MEATIMSFRRGIKTQTTNQLILHAESVDSREKAEKLIGKTVTWNAPGKNQKVLKGKITATHGRKGAVRALFETGVPGQAITQKAKIE
jgi:large subunit ribosomal protein L35Ae